MPFGAVTWTVGPLVSATSAMMKSPNSWMLSACVLVAVRVPTRVVNHAPLKPSTWNASGSAAASALLAR